MVRDTRRRRRRRRQSELAAGLETVLGDPDVVVERVRDRLDPAYDAARTCGYRWRERESE